MSLLNQGRGPDPLDPLLGILGALTYGPYQEVRGLLGRMTGRQKAELAADLTPGVGDVKALAYDLPRDLRDGNYGWAAVDALSAIPFVGALGDAARAGRAASDVGRVADDIKAFRDKWERQGVQNWVTERDDYITLDQVVVPEGQRGQGVGTSFMEELTEYADAVGKPVLLTPSTDFGGSSRSRLESFYRRFGFAPNKGDLRDYALPNEAMRRNPVTPPELPMDEASRMARAREMGFDTENVVYHGTKDDVAAFDPNPLNAYDSGWMGRGTYVSTNPHVASSYASLKGGAGGEQVMPLLIRGDLNLFDAPGHGYKMRGQQVEMRDGREAARRWAQDQTDQLRSKGYDGVRLHYSPEEVGARVAGDEILIFDPKNIRSRFARFDPSQLGSADLLAGSAGLLGLQTARQRNRETR